MLSKLRIPRCPRERDYVADVFHAGEIHEHALEAHAETGVLDSAETAEIEVPPVGLFFHAVRGLCADARLEHVEALLALAAADDLADARGEHIHRGDGLAV